MAFDKVIDSAALDAGMIATANAIREKAGNTDPIMWDVSNGFKNAVEAIQPGGGGGLPDGIPYTSGSFTLAANNANVTITHNLNSDKVFVMWAIKDNPAIILTARSSLMGFMISTSAYPKRTIDVSGYNTETKIYEAGPNEPYSSNTVNVRTSGPGWAESAADIARRVNTDVNVFGLYGTFEKGHVYEWIAVDISGMIPWGEEG